VTITTEEAERLLELGKVVPDGFRSIAAAISSCAAERDALRAENARLREVLERLARLGAEPYYGNSDGNMIARAALGEKE
jgi:hypothetical protein